MINEEYLALTGVPGSLILTMRGGSRSTSSEERAGVGREGGRVAE